MVAGRRGGDAPARNTVQNYGTRHHSLDLRSSEGGFAGGAGDLGDLLSEADLVREKKMQGMPRRATDEEDVALSAMNSFFDGMHQGRFVPQDRDELWKLLATITVRKATRELRRHHAQKRGGGAVRGESVFIGGANESANWGINEVMDAGNLPAMSMQLTATCADMLAQLEDDSLRAIARSRLEGFSNEEIAQRMQISLATVKRRLARIRETWS
jgi:DNA-directed RNA polymerase specialized sigma24 family protein